MAHSSSASRTYTLPDHGAAQHRGRLGDVVSLTDTLSYCCHLARQSLLASLAPLLPLPEDRLSSSTDLPFAWFEWIREDDDLDISMWNNNTGLAFCPEDGELIGNHI